MTPCKRLYVLVNSLELQDYQAIVDAEWQIIFQKLQALADTDAQVVLSKLPIGDLATQCVSPVPPPGPPV